MINPLQTAALAAVESLINNALAYDPVALRSIAELKDRVLHIRCSFPPLNFYVLHTAEGLNLQSHFEGEPDTQLSGNGLALAGLAINRDQLSNLSGSGVVIEGNQELLLEIRAILQELDIDWETALAQLVGDVPAYILGNSLRSAADWGATAQVRASSVASGFVKEEIRITPAASEFAEFTRDVKKLRSDTDRLAARIDKLWHKLTPEDKAG